MMQKFILYKCKRRKTMAYVISSECITCGACMAVCPTEAISAGDEQYTIDPDICVDCGLCEAECPVEAISAG
jgi:ferredoxin